jgi:hypothetical protein
MFMRTGEISVDTTKSEMTEGEKARKGDRSPGTIPTDRRVRPEREPLRRRRLAARYLVLLPDWGHYQRRHNQQLQLRRLSEVPVR